ncbi:plc-like phosphodiesterase TIM beta alpha-barrel domain protein [Fusarium beomiforme]|uniref:Plc-like phosphodiesterase TIM beta alpha-barrel domain protein n=1 Tax=Fusarium beomiforme TaxID=44412 RepID=A0A9P5E6Q7_9HYPO|nr:plc-like phosphodiesterase TIM beta alpha-barrel domain protein [Fusarium beomiforme]
MPLLRVLLFATSVWAACNGHDELCNRKYSDITFIGTHNSAFVGELPVHNQYISVTKQLDLRVRFLQAQTQDKDGNIQMCHTHCWELDDGPLEDYLKEVSNWIVKHLNEIVTLLLTNIDALPIQKFDEAFNCTGLKEFAFRPKKKLARDEWPILQMLLDDGTRLAVFMDYNMDERKVNYIINEFDYFWETPYSETDDSFPTCEVDRPERGDPTKLMGIMNHMLNHEVLGIVIPNQVDAVKTNSEDSIQKQIDLCEGDWGKRPNVVLLTSSAGLG